MRPLITEVKDVLLEYARLHFKSQSPAEAMATKHMKERALLDQILPPKVCFLGKTPPFQAVCHWFVVTRDLPSSLSPVCCGKRSS